MTLKAPAMVLDDFPNLHAFHHFTLNYGYVPFVVMLGLWGLTVPLSTWGTLLFSLQDTWMHFPFMVYPAVVLMACHVLHVKKKPRSLSLGLWVWAIGSAPVFIALWAYLIFKYVG